MLNFYDFTKILDKLLTTRQAGYVITYIVSKSKYLKKTKHETSDKIIFMCMKHLVKNLGSWNKNSIYDCLCSTQKVQRKEIYVHLFQKLSLRLFNLSIFFFLLSSDVLDICSSLHHYVSLVMGMIPKVYFHFPLKIYLFFHIHCWLGP